MILAFVFAHGISCKVFLITGVLGLVNITVLCHYCDMRQYVILDLTYHMS